MKNISLIIIGFMIAFSSSAKTPAEGFKKFYREYRDTPNTIAFKLPAGLASFLVGDEDPEVKEFLKNVDDIRFFIADNASNQMIIDLNRYLPDNLYKEIMVVKDGEAEIIFFARDNGKSIDEILMTVVDGNQLVVMCLNGEFTREDAKRIVKSIKTENAIKMRG